MDKTKKLSKKEFDTIILKNLIEAGIAKESFGYETEEERIYREYMRHS